MIIAVLGGGNSTEREVSLRSAKAVSSALSAAGFAVTNFDPIDPTVFDRISPGTIVFPILHGNNLEDGTVARELEKRGLPFLGSNSKSSKLCFDKGRARQAFQSAGLPIAQGAVVRQREYASHPLAKKPHVLKINQGGSSIGTYIVPDPANVDNKKVNEVFALGEYAVLEEFVEGTEITVAILDGKSLPVIEIRPPTGESFDYQNKYNGKTREICPPASLSEAVQTWAQAYAERAHQALGCRHLSRVDFIVRPDGDMVILEINTVPGMTDQSLYPLAAKTAGYNFAELAKKFVGLVERDYNLNIQE